MDQWQGVRVRKASEDNNEETRQASIAESNEEEDFKKKWVALNNSLMYIYNI